MSPKALLACPKVTTQTTEPGGALIVSDVMVYGMIRSCDGACDTKLSTCSDSNKKGET